MSAYSTSGAPPAGPNPRIEQMGYLKDEDFMRMDRIRLGDFLDSMVPTNTAERILLGNEIMIPMLDRRLEKVERGNPMESRFYVAPAEIRKLALKYLPSKTFIVDDQVAPAFFQALVQDGQFNVGLMRPYDFSKWWEDVRVKMLREPSLDETLTLWRGINAIEEVWGDGDGLWWLQHSPIVPVLQNNTIRFIAMKNMEPPCYPWIMFTPNDDEKAQRELSLLRSLGKLRYHQVAPGCLPAAWRDRATLRSKLGLDRMMTLVKKEARKSNKGVEDFLRGRMNPEHVNTFRSILVEICSLPDGLNFLTNAAYEIPCWHYEPWSNEALSANEVKRRPGGWADIPAPMQEELIRETGSMVGITNRYGI
ncbi:MAG: hypothetical protein M1831_002310 [Alyxoria varia]|nr:MAG: hypothetical protein M1831_002310 [Alyxoria varia]